MTVLKTFDDFINRIGGNFSLNQPIWGEINAATTANFVGTGSVSCQRCGDSKTLPSLPSGVTAYIPTCVDVGCNTAAVGLLTAKIINFGTFDQGNTTVGTFTDGSAMPTATIFNNASTSLSSILFAEVTTVLAGTNTSITVTYKNQSGTAGQTTSFTPTNASALQSCSMVNLAAGDWGVQDITAVARAASAGPTGVIKFWGIVPISFTGTTLASAMEVENLLTGGVLINRLGAADAISTFVINSTVAKTVIGSMYVVGDS